MYASKLAERLKIRTPVLTDDAVRYLYGPLVYSGVRNFAHETSDKLGLIGGILPHGTS